MFLDANIFIYAAGGKHPLKAPSQRVLQMACTGAIPAVTSTEVIQEIMHIMLRRKLPGRAIALGGAVGDLVDNVLPVTHVIMRSALELIKTHPRSQSRDVLHVATCLDAGITDIISADIGFDAFSMVNRIDPLEFANSE